MSTNAVWWIGLSAAAMLMVSQRRAAGEPWRAVEQPDLKQALEQAPVLQTESLGEHCPLLMKCIEGISWVWYAVVEGVYKTDVFVNLS